MHPEVIAAVEEATAEFFAWQKKHVGANSRLKQLYKVSAELPRHDRARLNADIQRGRDHIESLYNKRTQ